MNKKLKKPNKKAMELSLNTVALGVVILIVVVVVIIIFTGKTALFAKSLSGCESKPGAKCVLTDDCSTYTEGSYAFIALDFQCPETKKCCFNQCKSIGGACEASCTGEDLGSLGCKGGATCCK